MTAKELATSNLIAAIRAGRLSGVVNALDEGADIEVADVHGCRGLPLRTACFEGNLGIVRELLTRGASVNAAASDGPGAPLRLAVRNGHQEIVALLLQHGAQMSDATTSDTAESIRDDAKTPTQHERKHDDNIIEFSRHDTILATNDSDIPEQFGTKTNLLSMELLYLDENDIHHAPAQPKKDH